MIHPGNSRIPLATPSTGTTHLPKLYKPPNIKLPGSGSFQLHFISKIQQNPSQLDEPKGVPRGGSHSREIPTPRSFLTKPTKERLGIPYVEPESVESP